MDKPNIIFCLADDLGYGDLGCYGNPVIKTPNIDKLAKNGVKLTQCYAASTVSSPSRASILTGRMSYRVGIYRHLTSESIMHISINEPTIPKILKGAGYQTVFLGKWHVGNYRMGKPGPDELGFDYWLANEKNFDMNPTTLMRNGEHTGLIKGYQSEILVKEALHWLEDVRQPNNPFCMFLWFNEPHTPVRASEKFKNMYNNVEEQASKIKYGGPGVDRSRVDTDEKSRYFGCITQMDNEFGKLINKLDQLNLKENTIIIFTSDNGPEHREPTSWGSPGNFRGAKGHLHEGGIRVPGIIYWPEKIKTGKICEHPINGTDYLPTLAAVAGVEIEHSKKIDGINVLPVILDEHQISSVTPKFWWLYYARGGKQVCMRINDWKIMATLNPRGKPSKWGHYFPEGISHMDYIKNASLQDFVLYNLEEDPEETKNVSSDYPIIFNNLKDKIIEVYDEIQYEAPVWQPLTGKKKEFDINYFDK